ncbi:hypothetical protein SAMN05446935_8034 [Burkholderia sp. YR290]|nr:hypothetical protein SAMN05445504_9004 [Burkholderia sp. CF099]SKD04213.1 hypothetical protein SAMN05446934_9261 [Paraburkholderia hospita]SOE87410.1 hypothetical protein SAMN05446935_8034 [Burkholderia sp. YR290]
MRVVRVLCLAGLIHGGDGARECGQYEANHFSIVRYHWLCRDNGGKARKFHDDKESLRHQRVELIGNGSGHAAVLHLAFPDHMHRLNA